MYVRPDPSADFPADSCTLVLRPSFWHHGFLSSGRASTPQQQRKQPPGEKSTIGAAGQRRQRADHLEDFARQLQSWTSEKDFITSSTPRKAFEMEYPSDTMSEADLNTAHSQPARRNAICPQNLDWDLERGFPDPDDVIVNADNVYRIGPRPLLPEPEPLPAEPQSAILSGIGTSSLYRERTWDMLPPIAEVISKESRMERQKR